MIVTIKPIGREARSYRVNGVKRTYSATAGGMSLADIPMYVPKEMLARILLARVRISGQNGMDWEGRVWGRTQTGGLLCSGQQSGMAFKRFARVFARSGFDGFRPIAPDATNNAGAFKSTQDENGLTMGQSPATTASSGDYTAQYLWLPDHTLAAIAYSATVNHNSVAAQSYSSNTEAASSTQLNSFDPPSGFPVTSARSESIASKKGVVLRCYINATSTPSRFDTWCRFAGLRLYGQADTSLTVEDCVNILLDQIESEWLPSGTSYRKWIAATGDSVTDLVSDAADTLARTLGEAMTLTDHLWGWYVEPVAGVPTGVPHVYPIGTSAKWLVDVSEPGVNYREPPESVDGLNSSIVVGYRDTAGRNPHTQVDDADPDSYLNIIGMSKSGSIETNTTLLAEATTAGTAALNTDPVSLTVTIPALYSMYGARWPLSTARPGDIVRVVGLPRGSVEMYLLQSDVLDDSKVTLWLTRDVAELRRIQVS